jgi:hypothetical protein
MVIWSVFQYSLLPFRRKEGKGREQAKSAVQFLTKLRQKLIYPNSFFFLTKNSKP